MNTDIEHMINAQLIARGLRNEKVFDAIRKIPRHLFVPGDLRGEAYDDHPLPIGDEQTISQPFMTAWMTEALDLKGSEKVLEIGTGSGYQTALLSELAKEVYTIERIAQLSCRALEILQKLGYNNIFFRIGDGTEGWEEQSPFDRIIITAASCGVPKPLFEQLAERGKMLIPIGERFCQELTLVEKIEGELKLAKLGGCVFVPLVGRYGMKKE